MGYKKFIIKGYKGIVSNVTIDLEKSSLVPIIGINECGKTTLLEAIFAFDRFNDDANNGRHLENIENMYSTTDNDVKVEAEVEVQYHEFAEILNELQEELTSTLKGNITELKRISAASSLDSLTAYKQYFEENVFFDALELSIGRDLKKKKYYFVSNDSLANEDLNDSILSEAMRILPYTLYFDDFRDRLDEKIEIDESQIDQTSWIQIINRLFQLTDEKYSVFDLPEKNENIRRSIISEVEIKLNEELLKEWPNFSIQQNQPLEIKINYIGIGEKHYLEFLVVEKILVDGKKKNGISKFKIEAKAFSGISIS